MGENLMENNPELERAEIELQNKLRKERMGRQKNTLTDYILGFAALVHFLAAIASPLIFMILLASISDSHKIPEILLWLVFPAGLVSLGTAIGLFRILLLPKSLMECR